VKLPPRILRVMPTFDGGNVFAAQAVEFVAGGIPLFAGVDEFGFFVECVLGKFVECHGYASFNISARAIVSAYLR